MGHGSNMFRCGLVHSSGVVFLGTYGPAPGLIWKYDPGAGTLEQVAAPGEYQLDCMVEAPDGKVYIGTAYGGIVYQLDPKTGAVRSLGSPPVDSTSWIFTMIRTSAGEIYGAKGVGLFRLDWRAERLEPLGIVPGDHSTPPPNASSPITRMLGERPDGTLLGDTNRWLFRFRPDTGAVDLVADMLARDPACYALFLPVNAPAGRDAYFCVYSRFSGRQVRDPLYVLRDGAEAPEPVPLAGMAGDLAGHPCWYREGDRNLLLMQTWDEAAQQSHLYACDPEAGRVAWEWRRDTHEPGGNWLPGPGGTLYYFTFTRLLRADPATQTFVQVATNPTPAECRCLAMSPQGVLGTDTYDLGYAFTRDPGTGELRSHGKVWFDDHRCNYGPAAFAGEGGRYLLANHSEGMPALWVTDTRTNHHQRVGPSAAQLMRLNDGTVWGTEGPNPPATAFDAQTCWLPAWRTRSGRLFRYVPGAAAVEPAPRPEACGPLAEHPLQPDSVIAAVGDELWAVSHEGWTAKRVLAMPRGIEALCTGVRGRVSFALLVDGSLWRLSPGRQGGLVSERVAEGFGAAERGFFALASGKVIGATATGDLHVYDTTTGQASRVPGPPPLPAGPAVDPEADAWYFADRTVLRYELGETP
jgi:hypothetical protein